MIEFNDSDFASEGIEFSDNDFASDSFEYKGNIDLNSKPLLALGDGSLVSTRGIQYKDDNGKIAIIPTVSDNGLLLTDDEAIDMYKSTGQHLGMFDTEKDANFYHQQLTKSQGEVTVKSNAKYAGDQAYDYGVLDAIDSLQGNNVFGKATVWMLKRGYDVYKAGEKLGEKAFEIQKNWKSDTFDWRESTKYIAGQTATMGADVCGKTLKMAGELIEGKELEGWDYIKPHRVLAKGIGKALQGFGDTFLEASKDFTRTYSEYVTPSEDYMKNIHSGEFSENPSLARIIDDAGNMIPSLLAGRGVYAITKSTLAATLFMTNTDVVDTYFESREAGKDAYSSFGLYLMNFAGTAVLEKYGFEKVFGKEGVKLAKDSIGSLSRRITEAVVGEGLTEGGQTLYQNMVAKYGYDETRDVWQGVVDSIIGGAIGGGTMSAFTKSRYTEVVDSLKEKGLSQEDAEKVISLIADEVTQKGDTVNEIITENANGFVEKMNQAIRSMPEEMKQRYAAETGKVREEFIGEVSQNFPDWDSERLTSTADYLTSQTLARAFIENISPAEAKKKMAKMERISEEEFIARLDGDELVPFQFVGEKSNIAKEELVLAKSLSSYNIDNEKIRQRTGWFKGDDKKWRYEISDKDASLNEISELKTEEEIVDGKLIKWVKLGELLNHDKLYKAYPQLVNIDVALGDGGDGVKAFTVKGKIGLNTSILKEPRETISSLMHEIQHLIQNKEGFASGGSSSVYKEDYRKLSGEIEARNTQARLELSEEERKALSPKETRDIAKEDAIIVFDNGVSFSYDIELKKNKGAYIGGKIYLFENADISTIQHEYAHAFDEYLKSIDSPEAKAMRDEITKWEDQEAERKYRFIGDKKGYMVVERDGGKIVYSNNGKYFPSKESAKKYAMDEIFAQGVEKFVSTEEAPSNRLKRAFKAFIEFFKESYMRTKALDIELTDEVKDVYATMLGGASIDTFLHQPAETFIAERRAVQEQKQEIINEDIEDTNQVKFQEEPYNYLDVEKSSIKTRDVAGVMNKALESLSSRARRISEKLEKRIQRYMYNRKMNTQVRLKKMQGFLDACLEIRNNNQEDWNLLKYGMLNNNYDVLKGLSDKYNLAADFASVQEVLDELYDSLTNLGFEIEYKSDYLPRAVKDYEGFVNYTTKGMYSPLAKAIKDAEREAGQALTMEQRVSLINTKLRKQANNDLLAGVNHKKGRTVDYIDSKMAEFYQHPVETLVNYVRRMSDAIETAEFLGKGDGQGSIGEYVANLIDNGIIKENQQDEALNIIRASLEDMPATSKLVKMFRDAGYIATMGNFSSAITQIDDFNASWHNAGFRLAIKNAIFKTGKARDLNTIDLALDQIGDEFRSEEGMSKIVNSIFKATGLTNIDAWMKNTFINSDLERMKNLSESALREEIKDMFDTPAQVNQVVKDIKEGKSTVDTKFVSWCNLAKYQPISRFEMPEYYNGNNRIWYMLKSFTLKRLDQHLQNARKVADTALTKEKRFEALKSEMRLLAFMLLCGATKDIILDILYNRKVNVEDIVVNNMFGWLGLNKYFLYKAREEGIGAMAMAYLVNIPLMNLTNTLQRDLTLWLSEDSKGKTKRAFKDFDTFKYVPFVGGFYYWYWGRGMEKQKKQAQEESNKRYKKIYGKRRGRKSLVTI